MLRIALDLDGVLADTMRLWLKLWNRRTGQELSYDDLIEWDFWKNLGISEAEFMEVMNEAWRMWKSLPPTEPNLSEKVSKLKTLGRIDIVTARPRETEKYALKWLEEHGVFYDSYVWVRSSRVKSKLDYDVFIDDSPRIVDGCVMRRKMLLLYDRPWNRNISENRFVRRIRSLSEAYDILKEVLRK